MPTRYGTMFLSICAFWVLTTVHQVHAAIGQIKTVTGTVHIIRQSEKLPAKPGDLLESEDSVVTGAESSVGMTFIDNSRFSMGPQSHVSLTKFVFNPTTQDGEFLTKIDRGTLAIVSGQIAQSSPDAMKVKTRTTILGVRGTNFLVKVDE